MALASAQIETLPICLHLSSIRPGAGTFAYAARRLRSRLLIRQRLPRVVIKMLGNPGWVRHFQSR
jgi:hypothetical protein